MRHRLVLVVAAGVLTAGYMCGQPYVHASAAATSRLISHPASLADTVTPLATVTPATAATSIPTTDAMPTATAATTISAGAIVATAEQYVGYPYAYIGDSPATGFSCIGFAHFVYAQNGMYIPEELGQAYASAPHVDQSDLQPGDLVFFQNTAWNGISHVAIYIGNGKMIAADGFQTGVQWDNLGDAYWQEHYLGAARPLSTSGDSSATAVAPPADPAAPSATPAPTPVSSGPSLTPPGGASLAIKVGTPLLPRRTAKVYSGPNTTYAHIDTVTPHTTLTAVQTQGHWVNVSYNAASQYGWVYGPDLNLPSSAYGYGSGAQTNGGRASASGASPRLVRRVAGVRRYHVRGTTTARAGTRRPGQMLVVTADILFVRAGPSLRARILRRVFKGDRVRLLTTRHGWDYIAQRTGVRGWVYARWVR